MESAPRRKERFSCYTSVLLEVGERHTGWAEAAVHFRDQPDYTCSNFLFDGGHRGCDNVKTSDVFVFLSDSGEF